jgi:hypothetical protein
MFVCVYSVFVVLVVALRRADVPSKGSRRLCKRGQGPTEGRSSLIKKMIIIIIIIIIMRDIYITRIFNLKQSVTNTIRRMTLGPLLLGLS